jgi:CubicO group peptidase (beta-lactamase class C family)
MMKLLSFCSGLALFLSALPAQAAPADLQDFDRAARHVRALVEATRAVPGAPPAAAFIAVADGRDPVILVDGIADVRTGAKANVETPFYIASMTKAYMGVLAAELDRKGILKLDSTLADHWPDLVIPGTDTRATTLRNLLTHHMLFDNPALSFRTAYTDEVPSSDYPALLAAHSRLRPPGFSYRNIGYLLYGAILEERTGRSWKDWLAIDLLQPLGLDHTSARASDFPVVTAAHQWTEEGWHAFAMKSDPLMHAAGGLVTSPNDMARWLKAHLAPAALPASTFKTAQAAIPHPARIEGSQSCDGYALGWSRCSAHGIAYLEHGGGYTGFRAQMAILPERGIGFAFLFNSDSMTGGLGSRLMDQFIKALADPSAALDEPAAFAAAYGEEVKQQAAGRAARDLKDQADPKWGGWSWTPSTSVLTQYVGRYQNAAMGEMTVRLEGQELVAAIGAYTMKLSPAVENVFAGIHNPAEKREMVRFTGAGGARTLTWNDAIFSPVAN